MTQDSHDEKRRKHMALMDDEKAAWQSEAMHQNKLLHDALMCIEQLVAQLKMVLEREAETQARHDSEVDALEAKLAKAVDVLQKISNEYSMKWQAGRWARAALDEIKGEKK